MIRVTLACLECRQVLDGTFAVSKTEEMLGAFNRAHLFNQCRQERPDDGEEQEEPAAGANDATDGGIQEDGGEVIPRALKH